MVTYGVLEFIARAVCPLNGCLSCCRAIGHPLHVGFRLPGRTIEDAGSGGAVLLLLLA